MSSPAVSSTGVGAPPPSVNRPYEVSQQEVDDLFAAAGQGDSVKVLALMTKFGLDWHAYDIQRLTELSKHYGPLETHGDALISLLQTHDEGVLSANKEMTDYLDEAVKQAMASEKIPPPDIRQIIGKIKAKEGISEQEAKKLYSWALEMKEFVVPSDYRIETTTHQLNSLQDGYEEQLRKAGRLAEIV